MGAGVSGLHSPLTGLTAEGVVTLAFIEVTAVAPSRTEAGHGPLPGDLRTPALSRAAGPQP